MLKKIFLLLFNLSIGFFTTLFFPYILALALNRTHGNGNNLDGEIFVPFGIFFLVILIIINIIVVLIDVGIIKLIDLSNCKRICVIVWVAGIILGYIYHSLAIGRWGYLSGLFM